MAEFTYNNAKNISTSHISFKLNYGYYPPASYKANVDSCSRSKSVNKLVTKLRKLMIVYRKNLQHAQKFEK